jgi:hypothetical protein
LLYNQGPCLFSKIGMGIGTNKRDSLPTKLRCEALVELKLVKLSDFKGHGCAELTAFGYENVRRQKPTERPLFLAMLSELPQSKSSVEIEDIIRRYPEKTKITPLQLELAICEAVSLDLAESEGNQIRITDNGILGAICLPLVDLKFTIADVPASKTRIINGYFGKTIREYHEKYSLQELYVYDNRIVAKGDKNKALHCINAIKNDFKIPQDFSLAASISCHVYFDAPMSAIIAFEDEQKIHLMFQVSIAVHQSKKNTDKSTVIFEGLKENVEIVKSKFEKAFTDTNSKNFILSPTRAKKNISIISKKTSLSSIGMSMNEEAKLILSTISDNRLKATENPHKTDRTTAIPEIKHEDSTHFTRIMKTMKTSLTRPLLIQNLTRKVALMKYQKYPNPIHNFFHQFQICLDYIKYNTT